jgi:adenine-specific DNA methylase
MNFIANESAEKLRGGYYTPADIALFLSRWVLVTEPKAILEPSCGDGSFVRALGAAPGSRPGLRLTACELDPIEAEKARAAAAHVRGLRAEILNVEFLSWILDRSTLPPEFDAVVGNPPFVRYQYLTELLQQRAEQVIRGFGLRFTRHTNAWVPFVVASLSRLRPGGRLAMVVPSELLHVLHAGSIREYLLAECSRVLVLDPEEIWFDETLQGVVLLLAEKRAADPTGARRCGGLAIQRTRGRALLAQDPEHLFEHAEYVPGEHFPSKWTLALLSASERRVLDALRARPAVRPFPRVGTAAVGIVTGANRFFLVPDAIVAEYDLRRYAYPMFGRSEHVPGVIYDARAHADNRKAGYPTNFLWFGAREELNPGARRYLAKGEEGGLHTRYKCRVRSPWYTVPSVFTAPVAMLKRCHDHPRLILNSADAFTTDTAYRITPNDIAPEQLVYCFVNSLTALTAELEGRHYGGGVLELVPSEIARLLVPVTPVPDGGLLALDGALRSGVPSMDLLELQDRRILGAVGASSSERADVLNAWWALRSRRQRIEAVGEEVDDAGVSAA